MGAGLRKTNKKTKAEFSSQDSSPVSVLDFDQFIDDPEVTKSEEDTKSGESNSRRRLSPRLENQDQKHLSQRSDGNLIFDDRHSNKTEEPCPGSRKKVCHNHDYSNMWDEVSQADRNASGRDKFKCAQKYV
ncbi:hypothetical protein OIU74_008739 [Salix koriyanagi]|uniref:Uncharacterized protein n=1 Tax=Salix koriyanagi TaxID=2511006 RepID=A0A9Q0TQS7_9ROSI|nr:hypothetical protein OIU74_008739 [Salix koriyanagi]